MIELRHVFSGYGKQQVLKDVSVCFAKGSLTSVIGVNGCGKSTLLKTILGMVPLQSGEIAADGRNLGDLSRNAIARKIAYLSQGRNTPDMTVEQMVLHGRFPHLNYPRRYTKRDSEIAFAAMERVGIADLAHKPLAALSGGMRQNVYIAMALAQDTEYILLDEPTTYLDIAHQLELMRTLREFTKNGKGIVAVMHDIQMACAFSDRVVLLNQGKVAFDGDPRTLCAQGILEKVFGVAMVCSEDGKNYRYQYE